MAPKIQVARGRAKPLWRGHPWVFADSIASTGGAEPGDLVAVVDHTERVIGWGFFSPESKLAVRLLGREKPVDEGAWLRARLEAALRLRTKTLGLDATSNGWRLVHAEGDGLPGLVVDRYANHLVVQFSTVGMHRRRELILDQLEALLSPLSIHEAPDGHAARQEGFTPTGGLLRGQEPTDEPVITEHGVQFGIALGRGQKTGFFLDQRANRARVGALARERRVLDLHTFTGGFALHAAAGGAREVLAIDSSEPALTAARANIARNGATTVRCEKEDVQRALNDLARAGEQFDLVISDPPKFARSRAGIKKALNAYRDLHLRALRVVAPGGLLAASSCSGLVSQDAFLQTMRDAAADLGRPVRILETAGQAADHPVSAMCPEGRYLTFVLAEAG